MAEASAWVWGGTVCMGTGPRSKQKEQCSFTSTSQNSAWLKGCGVHFCVNRHYRGRTIDLTFCHVKSLCELLRATWKTLESFGYTGLYQQKPPCAQILLQGGPGRATGSSSDCSTSSFSCRSLRTRRLVMEAGFP